MHRILLYIGLALFLPGLASMGYSLWNGPAAWTTDAHTFWGVPIALFVFWIGLAHAGTLLSAIFLALGIRLDRRTAMIAELSTLCCLFIAGIFPLMHLGVLENFYMVMPFVDSRENFANVRSPLVWDFCCIAVYGVLSVVFFLTHLKTRAIPSLEKLRGPMAWLLFPLVLWVHSVVSLDFATTFVPQWRGAFFPVYFVAGAIYSGVALVNGLLCLEGYRVRLLERLMVACSWMLLVIWFWDFLLKGEISLMAFVFAGVLPQLMLLERIRDIRWARMCSVISIQIGLFAERFFLVAPSLDPAKNELFSWTDWGLISFSLGLFILLFGCSRLLLSTRIIGEGTYFGEVDGSDMAKDEAVMMESERSKGPEYKAPWTSEEFKLLRMPLLIGILVSILFAVWSLNQGVNDHVESSLINVVPVLYPICALVSCIVLYLRFWRLHKDAIHIRTSTRLMLVVLVMLVALSMGMLYAGGKSRNEGLVVNDIATQKFNEVRSLRRGESKLLWNSRCAACHGVDGNFNQKFVREFYPVPQKLSTQRIDSMGMDSLTQVILHGRNNMNAYEGRLTESETRALIEYMRFLAEQKESSALAGEAK